MSGLVSVLSVSAGTLLAIVLFVTLVFWYVKDITQKKHTVLRNYPIIGRLRYFFEQMGEYFRQYFFTGERDEKFSAIAGQMRARIPDATHHVISSAGHSAHFEKPDQYAATLEEILREERQPGVIAC